MINSSYKSQRELSSREQMDSALVRKYKLSLLFWIVSIKFRARRKDGYNRAFVIDQTSFVCVEKLIKSYFNIVRKNIQDK